MLGYEEMWESNAAFAPSSPTSTNQEPTLSTSHSLPRIEEKAEISEGEQSPSSQIITDMNAPKVNEISSSIDIVKSPIGKSVFTIPPPVPLAIVGKNEEVEDLTKKFPDSKTSSAKRHVRNKSIFQLPPQNEPAHQQEPSIPQLHLPSAQAIHDQIINRQLECYDIAIRDLAVSSTSKQEPKTKSLNPVTIQALKSSEVAHSDSFIDEGHRIMPDLLAGSKVAALAVAFSGNANYAEMPSKTQSKHEVTSLSKNDGLIISDENEEDDDAEGLSSVLKLGSVEKPIRKKRKSLLAMQRLEPTASQGSQGSQGNGNNGNANVNVDVSSSDSEEEPAYWGSTGLNKVLRQQTVIRKGEGSQEAEPSNIISPVSFSMEDIQHTSSSGSSNEDVTAPMEDIKE